MTIKVKICGIKEVKIAKVAINAGADYLGFVHFRKSPRHLEFEDMEAFNKLNYGFSKKVALLVNPNNFEIEQIIAKLNPDFLQLHGNESTGRVIEIKDKFKLKIIKAVSIGNQDDIDKIYNYDEIVDIILCDAKAPNEHKDALPGGNAISFDWKLISDIKIEPQLMLAGGLNSVNVGQAISESGVSQVDVSSGVELSPGIKDAELIKKFIKKAKSIRV